MKEESSSSNQTNATMKDYKLILFIAYFRNWKFDQIIEHWNTITT